MSAATLPLDYVLSLITPDPRAIADGRRRMEDVWHGRPTDSLPIVFGTTLPDDVPNDPDMHRHFEDDDKMLYDQAVGVAATARAGSDGQLALRADTGTGTLCTIAGSELIPSEFALPWTSHLTREEIEAFDPETADFAALGVMPRVRHLYEYFRAKLPACVNFFIADTQGPFALAHLLLGDDIFYALYDEPEFVHALLEKTTALYIKGSALMKEWIGEPLDSGHHFSFAMANGGVRACEDTSTLLSRDAIEEFVLPYQQRALEAFGGGWIHYCGDNPALLDAVLRNPAARGLNFGNPERHDFSIVLPKLIEAGKFYVGWIPRNEDEPLEAYFRRVVSYTGGTRTGLILQPQLKGDECKEPGRVIELWRSAQ